MGVRLPRRVIRKYTLARRLPVKLADIATDLDAIIYVRDALIAQGCQSSTEDGMCMYREGRLACAAGQLISDEHYTEDFETVTVATHDGIDDYDLTAAGEAVDWSVPGWVVNVDLLQAMQTTHDDYCRRAGPWADYITSQFNELLGRVDSAGRWRPYC
jgi:hypothetical protein